MVKVIGLEFQGGHQIGDFAWMLKQDKYKNAFFIFNDNQSQFLAHQADPKDQTGCAVGGGNAIIRPYQCESPPRAGGIPTGEYGITDGPGYPALNETVKGYIDQALASIKTAVDANGYDTVYYSGDGSGGLGHGIFNPCEDVKAYIVKGIESLAT